jgi:hypothetical protein
MTFACKTGLSVTCPGLSLPAGGTYRKPDFAGTTEYALRVDRFVSSPVLRTLRPLLVRRRRLNMIDD